MKKKLLIVGVGQGLGKSLALEFGQKGYELFLMARNLDKLKEIANELVEKGIKSYTISADVQNEASLANALKQVKECGPIDGVIYNVGITMPDQDNFTRKDLVKHFEVDVAGAYQTIQELYADLKVTHGFVILTGGVAGVEPFTGYLGLGVAKAGLRNLTQLLNRELEKDGIFVGTVTIYGVIKPNTHFDPTLIAKRYSDLANNRDYWEEKYE